MAARKQMKTDKIEKKLASLKQKLANLPASDRALEMFDELLALAVDEMPLVIVEAVPPCTSVLNVLIRDGQELDEGLATVLGSIVDFIEAEISASGFDGTSDDYEVKRDAVLNRLLLHVVDAAGIEDLSWDDAPGDWHNISDETSSMQELAALATSSPAAASKASPSAAPKKTTKARAKREGKTEKTAITRVKTKLLEELVGHAEELVQVKNTLHEICSRLDDVTLFEVTRRLDIISTSVMDDLLRTRMRPVSTLFSSFNRIVRDLSGDLGKKISLVLIGENVELDESVIEAIREPLVHIVRNSADHGIEVPEDRVAADKPATGTLILHAYNEPGTVVIKISDDGKGVDQDKLRKAAVKKGMISESAAEVMTEQEVLAMLFESGLSTADKVTAVSGRGVGMGVVRSKIEALRGTVEVKSVLGSGTEVYLRFPLTMATLKAAVVNIGGASYAVPMTYVSQIVRIRKRNSIHRVRFDTVGTTVDLGHTTITLIEPEKHLSINDNGQAIRDRYESDEGIQMIVFRHHNREWGLSVDAVVRLLDVVIKPVDSHMNTAGIFSGASVLGDGSLALVFDLPGVVNCAKKRLVELVEEVEARISGVAS